MSETILFMCPHGAAKSVMAMTYFQKLATEKGLDISSDAAGPFPDDVTYPVIVDLLSKAGIDASSHKPRKVTTEDITQAIKVVSIGCELDDLPKTDTSIENWDVPMVSEDPHGSWEAIKSKVEALVLELT